MYRDLTYIDDIIKEIEKLIDTIPEETEKSATHMVYNIGNNQPEKLMFFITNLEKALSNSLGRKVEFEKIYNPYQLVCRILQ